MDTDAGSNCVTGSGLESRGEEKYEPIFKKTFFSSDLSNKLEKVIIGDILLPRANFKTWKNIFDSGKVEYGSDPIGSAFGGVP